MYAPILTGWKANSIGVKTNSSYLEGFLGTEVTVSVSRDVEKGTIIFTGVLSDNNGNFIASYNPANKTFDYEQNIFMCQPAKDRHGYLRSEFSNVQLDHNNYFHTVYMSYFLAWEPDDTQVRMAAGPAEFFYGLDGSNNEVTGWAWTQLSRITDFFALDHSPVLDDMPTFLAKIGEGYKTWPGEDITYAYAYHDSTGFHDYLSAGGDPPASLSLTDLQALLPWTIFDNSVVAPEPGATGTITAGNISATSVGLSWTYAIDNTTFQDDLLYRVYYSPADNINTVADILAKGTAFGSELNMNSIPVTVTGLSSSTQYYFNVLVENGDNNQSAYEAVSATTTAS